MRPARVVRRAAALPSAENGALCREFFPFSPTARTMRHREMSRKGRTLVTACAAVVVAALGVSGVGAATGDGARGGGVTLALPAGWSKILPVKDDRLGDPRTLLVIGTEGVRLVESDCQVSSYRVPSDGAVVVVIGWRDAVGATSFLPLSGLRLRRGTFECFAGRGAVARVTRRDRDLQVNVMVGDRADATTIADALEAARSLAPAYRA